MASSINGIGVRNSLYFKCIPFGNKTEEGDGRGSGNAERFSQYFILSILVQERVCRQAVGFLPSQAQIIIMIFEEHWTPNTSLVSTTQIYPQVVELNLQFIDPKMMKIIHSLAN